MLPALQPLTLGIVLTGIVMLDVLQFGPVVTVTMHHPQGGQIQHRFDLQGS
jgi:hypothetical protein